jgi:hypothetical protein
MYQRTVIKIHYAKFVKIYHKKEINSYLTIVILKMYIEDIFVTLVIDVWESIMIVLMV